MQNDPHTPGTGIFSRLPKPTLRQRRVVAMGTAAAIVVVGLGFALLRQSARQTAAPHNAGRHPTTRAPRMLETARPSARRSLRG